MSGETLRYEAAQFLNQFYEEKQYSAIARDNRKKEVEKSIQLTGTYEHTFAELEYGAKLAWRNSNRCIGRLFWDTLVVRDQRHLFTSKDVASSLIEHIDLATNEGRIQPMISIFPAQREKETPVRIWNYQLIRYAGYAQKDGGYIGDPDSLAFTKVCEKAGWEGAGTSFDVLPLVIETKEEGLTYYEVPEASVKEIAIEHPENEALASLGLKWYAVPIVADMKLEIGGLTYPAAPFNGWYMGTEIGARNLADEARYNMLPNVAEAMGIPSKHEADLWRDQAGVELNRAVLYSFHREGVSIVDHHTAAKQFTKFEKQEKQAGRDVTGDWTWLIPPASPAATRIFHSSYDNTWKTPNYYYQERPYE
ncbi:nitric oxide synthase oxygenase [Salsuginibacillus kocurii]|uniref:nitric oxide synthase oxygenase n=1 Tax=Salsuginibacillus kocurii TaxID=427078 RepID=UPI000374F9C4|nr:nitric oxide synthase oxygenase [Salsuginibacillus kocurii]